MGFTVCSPLSFLCCTWGSSSLGVGRELWLEGGLYVTSLCRRDGFKEEACWQWGKGEDRGGYGGVFCREFGGGSWGGLHMGGGIQVVSHIAFDIGVVVKLLEGTEVDSPNWLVQAVKREEGGPVPGIEGVMNSLLVVSVCGCWMSPRIWVFRVKESVGVVDVCSSGEYEYSVG